MYEFEWGPAKAADNRRKHGVSFEIAARVFADPLCLSRQDRSVDYEQRWQTIGRVDDRLLLVAHTIRDDEDEDGQPIEIIRIISARAATRRERHDYEQAAF
jgi:uncharacterized DUF497 family protein